MVFFYKQLSHGFFFDSVIGSKTMCFRTNVTNQIKQVPAKVLRSFRIRYIMRTHFSVDIFCATGTLFFGTGPFFSCTFSYGFAQNGPDQFDPIRNLTDLKSGRVCLDRKFATRSSRRTLLETHKVELDRFGLTA